MTTIYSIGDLHLSDGKKPMDVFGDHWADHFDRVCEDWRTRVGPEDIVLLPGDLSWALSLSGALSNLRAIAALPGIKVMIRGNHDFWWSSLSQLRNALPERMFAIQNDSVSINGILIAGTRGWLLPDESVKDDDLKIYRREVMRLNLSLKSARAKSKDQQLVCMMHFPPLTVQCQDTEFTRLLEEYGVSHVVYGHLHGPSLTHAFRGEKSGVFYHQVSSDGIGFRLYEIALDKP